MSYEEILEKERHSQSEYSPGVIVSDEKLARVIFTPKHFENGKVLPVAFDPAIFNGLC